MRPYLPTPHAGSRGPRRLRALAAFAILLGAAAGCTRTRDQVASEPPPTPAELSRGPSPLFDDEVRPGSPAGLEGPKVLDPAGRKEGPPAARLDPPPPPLVKKSAAAAPPPAPEGAGEARLAAASARPGDSSPQPSIRTFAREAPEKPAEPVPGDSLEETFQTLRQKFTAAASRTATDEYAAIERSDLETKLIALFFIRDQKKIEEYRDLIRSFREEGPVNVELELLKAALYQKVGQTDLRDRAMERVRETTAISGGSLRLVGLAFAREIRGYRTFTPLAAAEFAAGGEALLYGEIEGYRSTPLASGPRAKHRRSFAAELVLRDGAGAEVDRRELLRAGQAVEVVEDPAKPVHFWGRYPLPAQLAPGPYRIEIEVQDIEGQRRAKGKLLLKIRA